MYCLERNAAVPYVKVTASRVYGFQSGIWLEPSFH
jgi:hypothetical protein